LKDYTLHKVNNQLLGKRATLPAKEGARNISMEGRGSKMRNRLQISQAMLILVIPRERWGREGKGGKKEGL